MPQPSPDLAPVFLALSRMGRDANGHLLFTERVAWLNEAGVEDPDERDLFHLLFDTAEAERSAAQAELHEEAMSAHRSRA